MEVHKETGGGGVRAMDARSAEVLDAGGEGEGAVVSYRERLAKLEAEDEAAAKAEYEKRLAERARKPVQVPFDAARGQRDETHRVFILDRGRSAAECLDPSRQKMLRDLARRGNVQYRGER